MYCIKLLSVVAVSGSFAPLSKVGIVGTRLTDILATCGVEAGGQVD